MPWVRLVISLLCAVGFYASVFMLRKTIRDARGELHEPSVVQTPRAKLLGGIPNAAFGCVYYPAAAVVAWLPWRSAWETALAVSAAAAAMSLYLAYSLLFVTKRTCPYCWTAHAANWLILAGFIVLSAL